MGTAAFALLGPSPTRSTARHLSTRTRSGRDFFVEVEDADGVARKVHVFDGGPYLPQASATPKPPLVLIGGTAQVRHVDDSLGTTKRPSHEGTVMDC